MAKKSPSRRKFNFPKGFKPDNLGVWLLGGLLFSFFLFLIISLVGYAPNDPTPLMEDTGSAVNPLGLVGAYTASVLYGTFGLAAWVLVFLPWLSLPIVIKEKSAGSVIILTAGMVWLLISLAALLGQAGLEMPYKGTSFSMGGNGGLAMARGLFSWAGAPLAWGLPVVLAVGGLGLLVWSSWSFLGPFLEPGSAETTKKEPKNSDPVIATPEQYEPEPEPEPEPESEPESEAFLGEPEKNLFNGQAGPKIRPRKPKPNPASDAEVKVKSKGPYQLPPLELLAENKDPRPVDQADVLRKNSRLLEEKLNDFGVKGQVVEVAPGPVVTMYEFKPAPGVKISKVANLSDDLAMNLKARSIRIVAPIPGKAVIGIEIPSQQRETVYLRELLGSKAYQKAKSPLTLGLGKDILGAPVANNLGRMPHLLIAGATGAGKSVFINTMVLSILYRATPDQVRMLMVDPKRIELSTYNDIPHLLYPIITNPQEATAGLRWAVNEMERRYELLARMGVRNIESFNQKLKKDGPGALLREGDEPDQVNQTEPLPYIVVIIDELADLMMVASKEVEALITRLAQMARAAGLHLVLATQRPSVDVITGLIKANFPSRISFQVTSRVDSRTILDQQGAEQLLGKGDMLFAPPGASGLMRLHGAFVSDTEIETVADFVRGQAKPDYDPTIVQTPAEGESGGSGDEPEDERYGDAVALVRETGQASISFVQRRLRVGYNRAARMIEQMEREGIVGPSDGSRPREVLIRD